MGLDSWEYDVPEKGTYTVLTVTSYTSGDREATATTIFDPDVIRKPRQKLTQDELLESAPSTGDEAIKVLDDFFDPKQLSEIDKEANKQRSLRRARSVIRKKIIEGQLDHFLTLTYKENKTDLKECWKDWKKFIRLAQKKYPNLKYLVIVERQKRGAVHFHAAIHGYMHANSIRALWLSVIGEGNIDIKRKRHNQSLHGLACYITKYLTKQYDELESFQNLYRSSKNIKLNIIKFYLPKEFALIRDLEIEQALIFWVKQIKQFWQDSNGLYSCCWASSLQP